MTHAIRLASVVVMLALAVAAPAAAEDYLGRLGGNPHAPDSTANPYGVYGSRFSPQSSHNPYSPYGSRTSPLSPCNPYAATPPLLIGE